MTRHALEEIGGGIICLAAAGAMVAENPWSILLLALCVIWS